MPTRCAGGSALGTSALRSCPSPAPPHLPSQPAAPPSLQAAITALAQQHVPGLKIGPPSIEPIPQPGKKKCVGLGSDCTVTPCCAFTDTWFGRTVANTHNTAFYCTDVVKGGARAPGRRCMCTDQPSAWTSPGSEAPVGWENPDADQFWCWNAPDVTR